MLARRRPASLVRRRVSAHWADLAVVPLVLGLSVLPLLWFGRNWRVPPDGAWYLVQGWNLATGQGYTVYGDAPSVVRGPVFPALLGLLARLLGRNTSELAWAVRLLALLNPLLLHLLVRKLAGSVAGLIAAGLVAFFGYSALVESAFNIDDALLAFYLASVLVLLAAVERSSAPLSLLSGVLLGLAVLLKESAVASAPLALLAALLLGWSLRGVLLHYLALAAVCLPWWVWVWVYSDRIYLLGRPTPARLALVLAGVVLLALSLLAYRAGWLPRALRSDRRRQLAAWLLALGWVGALSVLLLVGIGRFERRTFRQTGLGSYLAESVLGATPLWYLLPLALGYAAWGALRGEKRWAFYLVLLTLQAPPSVLTLAQRFGVRQWMIPQALMYGALAALFAEVARRLVGGWRQGRRPWPHAALAAVLLAGVAAGAAMQAQPLLHAESRPREEDPNHQINLAEWRMHRWIARNVAAGDGILTTWLYSYQLGFQDGGARDWHDLQLHQMTRFGLVQSASCLPWEVCALPADTIWVEINEQCGTRAQSLGNVLSQMQQTGSRWLLVTREPGFPGVTSWANSLPGSGAFKVAYSTYLNRGPTVEDQYGLAILRPTGKPPRPVRVRMNAATLERLVACEREAYGDLYVAAIRHTFPNGINIIGRKPRTPEARALVQQLYPPGP